MAGRTPYELARDTLKQLTVRKLPPTPENYQTIFHEMAGTKRLQPFPEEQLLAISKQLPLNTPGQQRLQAQFDHAVRHHNWASVQQSLASYLALLPTGTRAVADGTAPATGAVTEPVAHGQPAAVMPAEIREQLTRLIEHALPALGVDDAQLATQGKQLLLLLKSPGAEASLLRVQFANFNHRLSFASEEQAAIKTTLLSLLQLVFQNIGDITLDDRWLQGQMQALQAAATPPLTLRRLEDVRTRLKDVIVKQIESKEQAKAAQEEMKHLLAAFVDRMADVAESSGSFKGKIETFAKEIDGATTLAEVRPVLQEAVRAARAMAVDTQRVGDELRAMREKANETEQRIAKLEEELHLASSQARHDPLTGVLNRKGLDEALEREIAAARRRGLTTSVALLDIDNFKKLNDQHGHSAGDAALVYLAEVLRECIRLQDSLGRYGGEEFVVLMPDTSLDVAVEVMTRVQRELSKRFFLTGSEKVLITFSAGVAELRDGEGAQDAVVRADQAMYLAKRSGKNRVLAG